MINGVFVTAHQFNHANIISTVYMTTATLPVRYEIENIAGTASSSAMRQICASVISNGGYNRLDEDWTAARIATVNVSSDFYPLVAIRLSTGRTDAVVVPSGLSVVPVSQGDYQYALIRNPTDITGGSWVTHTPSTGNIEYNISATAMTGGIVVHEGLISASNQANSQINLGNGSIARFDLQLGRTNAETPVSDVIVLAIRSLGGTQSAIGSLSWFDLI
jgi:hypothetical protein